MATEYDEPESLDEADGEDYEIANVVMDAKKAEEISEENCFRPVPPGDHHLRVSRIIGKVKLEAVTLWVGGKFERSQYIGGHKQSFEVAKITVCLCMVDDSGCQVTDQIWAPATEDPQQLNAYFHGVDPSKPNIASGFQAQKFCNFVGSIGFDYERGKTLPPGATKLSNWKNRTVIATVAPGKDYEADDGTMKPGKNQVRLFSYRRSSPENLAMLGKKANNLPAAATSVPKHSVPGEKPATQAAPSQPAKPAAAKAKPKLNSI